jgi:hypothetical protein
MKRRLTRVFIAALLFVVAILISSAWADNTLLTIIYSNNINGQVDPSG